jgi:hypothetical protein
MIWGRRSPSQESDTYTQLPPSESESIPEKFLEETKKDRRAMFVQVFRE